MGVAQESIVAATWILAGVAVLGFICSVLVYFWMAAKHAQRMSDVEARVIALEKLVTATEQQLADLGTRVTVAENNHAHISKTLDEVQKTLQDLARDVRNALQRRGNGGP